MDFYMLTIFIITNHFQRVGKSSSLMTTFCCLPPFPLYSGFCYLFSSCFFLWLLAKAHIVKIFIKSDLCRFKPDNILCISFAKLFVFFRLDNGQLFLLDPVSVDLASVDDFLLEGIIDFNSLIFVVLFKGILGGLLNLYLNFSGRIGSFSSCSLSIGLVILFRFFLESFFVEFISDVADVSSACALFSWSISKIKSILLSACAASSIQVMAITKFFSKRGGRGSIISDLFSVFLLSVVVGFPGWFWVGPSGWHFDSLLLNLILFLLLMSSFDFLFSSANWNKIILIIGNVECFERICHANNNDLIFIKIINNYILSVHYFTCIV